MVRYNKEEPLIRVRFCVDAGTHAGQTAELAENLLDRVSLYSGNFSFDEAQHRAAFATQAEKLAAKKRRNSLQQTDTKRESETVAPDLGDDIARNGPCAMNTKRPNI